MHKPLYLARSANRIEPNGECTARIAHGFGAQVLASDPVRSKALEAMGVHYVALADLLARSDAISLHIPLTEQTAGLIDSAHLAQLKPGALLINTARGGLVDHQAIIQALDAGVLGGYAMDVYEHESGVFFADRSNDRPDDPVLANLLERDNVLITPHQGFLTEQALTNIAESTLSNLAGFLDGRQISEPENLLVAPPTTAT